MYSDGIWNACKDIRDVFTRHSGAILDLFEVYSGCIQEVFGRHSGTILEVFGRCSGGFREVSERFPGGVRRLPGGYRKEFGIRKLFAMFLRGSLKVFAGLS